jgi:hypothetical protein
MILFPGDLGELVFVGICLVLFEKYKPWSKNIVSRSGGNHSEAGKDQFLTAERSSKPPIRSIIAGLKWPAGKTGFYED